MEQREFAVEAEDAGQRIDRFLAGEDTGLSRRGARCRTSLWKAMCWPTAGPPPKTAS